MVDILYRWPEAARVGSRVPKEKFYEQGSLPPHVRARFVSEVSRITWAYKLAGATIKLPDSKSVPEIQVFHVDAKAGDISERVLTLIDKAIPSPIIFEVRRTLDGIAQVRTMAVYKVPGEPVPKVRQYFGTGWICAKTEREPLPTAISLPALYAALLKPLIKLEMRPGEAMSEVADRLKEIGRLEREILALERKIRNETQLNHKFELRRYLKAKEAQLEKQR